MLIEQYTPNWVKDFQLLKLAIENGLQGIDCTIEHVGSTAVPNLDAKPIIDIDIIYTEQDDFEKIKSGLLNIGYDHHGNQGIEDREVFKRNNTRSNTISDRVKHHLYVCPIESKALERHILTRNILSRNDWARATYQAIKYALAEKANQNRKVYAALKEQYANAFFDFIIQAEKQRQSMGTASSGS